VEYNRHNIDKYKSKSNLDEFFAWQEVIYIV
jgi:hypothetical protein